MEDNPDKRKTKAFIGVMGEEKVRPVIRLYTARNRLPISFTEIRKGGVSGSFSEIGEI